MYECEVCKRKYRSEHWLRRHLEQEHGLGAQPHAGALGTEGSGQASTRTDGQATSRSLDRSGVAEQGILAQACRGLGIEPSDVMSFKVYEDMVVIVEGPVGYKRVWRRGVSG